MSYIKTLDSGQKELLDHIVSVTKQKGYDKNSIAAILSIVAKESNFRPKSEKGYGNTANDRIRKIFGSRLSKYSDAQLSVLKKNDIEFFNAVYGGRFGNKANEGYKFRGRTFNQLTFKGNYQLMELKTGHKIIDDPDLVNDKVVGTDVMLEYFKDAFHKAKVPMNGHSLKDAVLNYYRANAGFGKELEEIEKDVTGGLKKARGFAQEFLDYVSSK